MFERRRLHLSLIPVHNKYQNLLKKKKTNGENLHKPGIQQTDLWRTEAQDLIFQLQHPQAVPEELNQV